MQTADITTEASDLLPSLVLMQVNRRYWLQLRRTLNTPAGRKRFVVLLDPQVARIPCPRPHTNEVSLGTYA